MLVQEKMTASPVTVYLGETVAAAARLMGRHNIGALPVVDAGGRLRGMLTDRDVALRCAAAGKDPNQTQVRSVMSAGAVTVQTGDTLPDAAARMEKAQVHRLPVVENGRLVGMLSRSDLFNEE